MRKLRCRVPTFASSRDCKLRHGQKSWSSNKPVAITTRKAAFGGCVETNQRKSDSTTTTAMFARSSGRALVRAIDASSQTSIPSFLIPALHRPFSASTANQSKLGRTPISIPPGVELTVSSPWLKKDATNYKKIYKKTVTVEGPLGKQSLEVPAFVNFDHDADSRKTMLSIENKDEKNQREMWGALKSFIRLMRSEMGVDWGISLT